MTNLTITNKLDGPITVWDSYADQDDKKNYFGTLTKLIEVAAGAASTVAAPHAASTLIVDDKDGKPVTRWSAGLGKTAFTVTADDVAAMAEANAFVDYVAKKPDSAEAKTVAGMTSATKLDAYFKTLPQYDKVTGPLYMTALTYRAAHPAQPDTPPQERTYSLSQLITVLTGSPYPDGMPDITVSNMFFRDDDGVFKFGGVVTPKDMPFDPSMASIVLKLMEAAGPVHVKIDIDTNVGLNLLGTRLSFFYDEIDVPLGGDDKLRIVDPSVMLTINPAFKFVVLQVGAHFPFTVFQQTFDTKLSMVLDNVEIEVGFDLDAAKASLPSPPALQGVHLDDIGFGMGIIFQPPGYAFGVQGKIHVGDGGSVTLDDDTFALILDIEGEIPNPIYLAFYVPKLDLPTLLAVFTNQKISIDFPVEFSDLSLRWCENPLEPYALPDGTLAKGGFGFCGQMDMFGLEFFADVDLGLDHITADASMAPLNFGRVFGLTGDGKPVTIKIDDKGNPIRNNFVPKTAAERAAIKSAATKEVVAGGGPEMHLSTEASPYFKMNAKATLFGVMFEQIDATVDSTGITFHLKMPLAEVTCLLSQAGAFSGKFSYGPDFRIPLPSPLGSIHLQATTDLAIALTKQSDTLDFKLSGGFSFMGLPLTVGPMDVDVDIGGLEQLTTLCEKFIVDHATDIFSHLLGDATVWAKAAFDKTIEEVDNIASGLKDFFKHTANEAAQILHDIGMDPNDVASQLKTAFTDITSTALATAMMGPFALTYSAAGALLKAAGFSPDSIAQAMHGAFGLDAGATAKLLGDLGEPLENISKVMQDVFTLSPDMIGDVLKTAGFPAQAIADAFKVLGGPFADVGNAISSALETVVKKLDPRNW
jgi:hypothetical protein